MSELLDLAERCEKATGPDRELDAEIARTIGIMVVPLVRNVRKDPFGKSDEWIEIHDTSAESYTASIDAATSLVPVGVFEEVWKGTGAKLSSAQLIYPQAFGKRRRQSIYTKAATEPLAICAAALRARASIEAGTDAPSTAVGGEGVL